MWSPVRALAALLFSLSLTLAGVPHAAAGPPSTASASTASASTGSASIGSASTGSATIDRAIDRSPSPDARADVAPAAASADGDIAAAAPTTVPTAEATDDPAAPSDADGDVDTTETDATEPDATETDATDDGTSDDGTSGTDVIAPGLPGTAPPGFSEEQYRRFVNTVTTCGIDPGRVCEWTYSITGNATLAEALQWVFDVPMRVLLVALVAIAVNRLVRRWVLRHVDRAQTRRNAVDADDADDRERFRRDALRAETLAGTIGGAATVAIFSIATLVALAELGVTIGPLLAGAGIVGIALGFGAQHLVRDVLAGLFVIMEDQYGVGDIIDVGRTSGTVEAISLRITKIRDVHGTLWFVPNGVVSEVGNLTQLWARAIIDFDIDYRADHERAGEIIKETADRVWRDPGSEVRILEEPALWGVESLGDSSVVIRIAVKTAPAEQWTVARLLRSEVKKALDAEGIEIPFPQHTVWIHGEPAPN